MIRVALMVTPLLFITLWGFLIWAAASEFRPPRWIRKVFWSSVAAFLVLTLAALGVLIYRISLLT